MNERVAFFYKHAGWSYDPAKETPHDGRLRGAVALASAESWASRVGLSISWEDDWSVGNHQQEYGEAYDDGEPDTCEAALARNERGDVVASLSCIDGADAAYRRVIEADLALEAMGSMLHGPTLEAVR
jgi:hypothetical protein